MSLLYRFRPALTGLYCVTALAACATVVETSPPPVSTLPASDETATTVNVTAETPSFPADTLLPSETSATDFPADSLMVVLGTPEDTLYLDEYAADYALDDDTLGVDADRVFERAWNRQSAARDLIREARTQIDTALALLDTIPEYSDSTALVTRDEMVIELSQLVRQIALVESRNGFSRNGEMPLELNEFVETEIRHFQGRERRFFLASYARAGAYLQLMTRKFSDAGMPEQLVYLAFIESGFKTNAFSRARALGPWQFIASTGNRYGLTRDRWIDRRRDFAHSTDGAIAYLTDLHAMFGDWNTAIAAYNSGEGRVLRVINRQRENYLDQFWDLYIQLPQETRRYVPRFHAVLNILSDPERWGFTDLPAPNDPVEFDTLVVEKQMSLANIASRIGVAATELEYLNPELRHKITPEYAYALRVPPGRAPQLADAIDRIPESKLPDVPEFVIHRVRYGQTLSTIAQRYRTSARAIQLANNLRSAHRIRAGQRLRIPVRNASYYARRTTRNAVQTPDGATVHVVRRGDTLWEIAQAYGTTVTAIRRLNNMGRSSRINPGERLVVKPN